MMAGAASTSPPGQHARVYRGAIACALDMVSKEGVSALFKGMAAPLAFSAPVNALAFGAYSKSQRVFAAYGLVEDSSVAKTGQRRREAGRLDNRGNTAAVWTFIGGSFAGLCQTIVVLPVDNIKVKLQVQIGALASNNLQYKGSVDCAVKLVRTQGVHSLFRGSLATFFRDTPALGLFFTSHQAIKGWLKQRGLGDQASSFWAGGLAGALRWFVVYPFDVVKSIQQAAADPLDPSTRKMAACFRTVYNSGGGGVPGVRRLYRGLATTLIRAVPVNAVIFPTFELTVTALNQVFPSARHS